MSSRAWPSVRRVVGQLPYPTLRQRQKNPLTRSPSVPRDWSDGSKTGWERAVVCKRCKLVMQDLEPHGSGSFHHWAKPHQKRALQCSNNGQHFHQDSLEVEPFRRKAQRRRLKRRGIRP